MKFLLDTDHASILFGRSGLEYAALTVRMAQHPAGDVTSSSDPVRNLRVRRARLGAGASASN